MGIGQPAQIGGGGQAAFRHDVNMFRNSGRQPGRHMQIGHEGLEIAVVDADHVGIQIQGPVQLLGVMDLDQRVHAPFAGGIEQGAGGVIPVSGTIEASPAPAPGRTVTITAAGLLPPVASAYYVTVDGVDVAGPFTTPAPDFAFSADVALPANLAAGTHSVAVYAVFDERKIVFAYFPFEVALAATGVDATAPVIAGSIALALGTLLLLAARRRRTV